VRLLYRLNYHHLESIGHSRSPASEEVLLQPAAKRAPFKMTAYHSARYDCLCVPADSRRNRAHPAGSAGRCAGGADTLALVNHGKQLVTLSANRSVAGLPDVPLEIERWDLATGLRVHTVRSAATRQSFQPKAAVSPDADSYAWTPGARHARGTIRATPSKPVT